MLQEICPLVLQDIAEDYPDYLDAYLRLACIERKQGNLKKAIDWAEKGIDRAEATSKGSASHTDLLAMAGQLVMHSPVLLVSGICLLPHGLLLIRSISRTSGSAVKVASCLSVLTTITLASYARQAHSSSNRYAKHCMELFRVQSQLVLTLLVRNCLT